MMVDRIVFKFRCVFCGSKQEKLYWPGNVIKYIRRPLCVHCLTKFSHYLKCYNVEILSLPILSIMRYPAISDPYTEEGDITAIVESILEGPSWVPHNKLVAEFFARKVDLKTALKRYKPPIRKAIVMDGVLLDSELKKRSIEVKR